MLQNIEELAKRDDLAAKAAQKYASQVYQKLIFEALSKDMLAAIKFELKKELSDASDAELEMRARASENWKKFREEQFVMLKEAGKAQIQYENALRRFEAVRSGLALKREEVKRFPSG